MNIQIKAIDQSDHVTDILYRLILYFPNFQEDIFENNKVILHEFLQEFGHVIWLIHDLN